MAGTRCLTGCPRSMISGRYPFIARKYPASNPAGPEPITTGLCSNGS